MYLPDTTGPATNHSDAQQVNWVSGAGDHAGDATAAAFTTQTQSWYFVSDVIVRSSRATGTVVAFGDSITDGFQSTVGANARWPNTVAGEAKREAVNAWIRHSGWFDGVIDFDKLMGNPAGPLSMNPIYDSGDHLHPNDAGYQVMANAINLGMLFAH